MDILDPASKVLDPWKKRLKFRAHPYIDHAMNKHRQVSKPYTIENRITSTKIGTFAPAGLEGPFQEKAIAEESAMRNEAGARRWPMHLKEPIEWV